MSLLIGHVGRRWLILGICVALGFGAGMLRREMDPSLQDEREQEIRRRLAGPEIFLSDSESRRLGQELIAIDRRAFASDLVSGVWMAALVALIWFLARARPKWGQGLAIATGALATSAPVGLGTHVTEGLPPLIVLLRLVVYGASGAAIAVVVWIVAKNVLESETASGKP